MLAWHDGTTHTLAASEWAGLCSTFLGAGFRIDLPGGPQRTEAAAHERGRVARVADLLGTDLTDSGWQSAAQSHPDNEIEVIGGWPRTYLEPSTLWVSARRVDAEPDLSTAALFPSPAHPRPTTGLPMFSRLGHEVALAAIDADCGIWADPEGRIVTSTAGPIIAQRADGTWATGTDAAGWLATRVALERSARPDLRAEDLISTRYLGLIRRARGVQPLTYRP